MSRVINPNGVGKERGQLMKAVAVALRELLRHGEQDDHSRDLVAFIAFGLRRIGEGIDTTVAAWEKRGYWVKADRFRLDWEWTTRMSESLQMALINDDWGQIAALCVQLGGKVAGVRLAKNPRIGTPWEGAWGKLKKLNYSA
jgi:hypothetical protein